MLAKRRALTLSLIAAGAGLTSVSFAQAPAPIVIKVAYETSETHLKARSAALFKQEVEKRSGGRIQVQVFPNSSLFPSRQEVSAAIQNQVQMILPYVNYYEAVSPRTAIFTMPMLFRDHAHLQRAAEGAVGRSVYEELEAKNLKVLAYWYETPTNLFTTSKEITSMDGLKGFKVRIAPSPAIEAAVKRLGAAPASIAGSELYLALQNGTVNGVFTTPTFAQSIKLTDTLKTMTRVNLMLAGYIVSMNKTFYQGLPADLKGAVDESIRIATEYNKKQIVVDTNAAEGEMTKAGIKVLDLPAAERQKWEAAIRPVWDGQSAEMKKLIADAVK